MPNVDGSSESGGIDTQDDSAVSEAIRSTESYETEDGVVFYDSKNPLAWMETDEAVDLDSAA
jgi:hypothetical protein